MSDPAGWMTRSEEQLRVRSEWVVVGRARLVRRVVTEDVTYTVPVRREEIRLEHDTLPVPEAATVADDGADGAAERTCEMVRHEERVVITKRVVPVERVRMTRRVATADTVVHGRVRAERVDVER